MVFPVLMVQRKCSVTLIEKNELNSSLIYTYLKKKNYFKGLWLLKIKHWSSSNGYLAVIFQDTGLLGSFPAFGIAPWPCGDGA